MPVPIACPVTLAPEEHARLESLVRAHSTPQALAFRCRLILRIAAQTAHRICKWPPNWPVSVIRWADGVSAIWRTASTACRMPRARGARVHRVSLERVEVLAMATRKRGHVSLSRHPVESGRLGRGAPAASMQPMSRSSIWRILEEADLKPHRSVVLAQQPRSRL